MYPNDLRAEMDEGVEHYLKFENGEVDDNESVDEEMLEVNTDVGYRCLYPMREPAEVQQITAAIYARVKTNESMLISLVREPAKWKIAYLIIVQYSLMWRRGRMAVPIYIVPSLLFQHIYSLHTRNM